MLVWKGEYFKQIEMDTEILVSTGKENAPEHQQAQLENTSNKCSLGLSAGLFSYMFE